MTSNIENPPHLAAQNKLHRTKCDTFSSVLWVLLLAELWQLHWSWWGQQPCCSHKEQQLSQHSHLVV
jgi:hypothetical protein